MLWRWHFYAGLFVMPFLVVLAVTGTIYCFQPQIEPLLYPHLLRVEPGGERLPAQTLLDGARASAPAGAVATTYAINADPRASAEFVFRLAPGRSESVYLNPYTGDRLGTLSVEDRFMKQVRMLHRALLVGKPGELLMELAGCWVLVMLATGLAMWWPRLRVAGGRAFAMAPAAGKRGWWKELHSVLGVWLAIGALGFVLSGLPWTASWGQQFKALATKANLGRPAAGGGHEEHAPAQATPAPGAPASHAHASQALSSHDPHAGHTMESLPLSEVPWATGLTRVPEASGKPAMLTLDEVVRIAGKKGAGEVGAGEEGAGEEGAGEEGAGTGNGCQVALPTKPGAVYTVSCFPADPRAERTLHIDPHDGRIVRDIAYGDYGPVARAVSYGTSLHMGRYFGVANQIVCAAISLGLMGLAISGFVMWWKRRPARALAAPGYPASVPPMRAWVVGLGILGAVFPMMGATMLAVWLLDRGVMLRQARRVAA
ncbi:PepSY-associated TM helix domain-containing protein [Cupriavidus plantarum]|uniref:PepSY-associated TM helix domain-containing protein n=1 Tax=Cupriavidus plantarum TaxID=942865 RepID=UPI001B04F221|nr:PepSY domain-containing protein [Cupriavidus plantarum]CAG2137120.1 hypothetical protein LMG26296_02487 [Cupriavidus plantarum]